MNKTINYEEKLINSLTDKGAIINGIAISNGSYLITWIY